MANLIIYKNVGYRLQNMIRFCSNCGHFKTYKDTILCKFCFEEICQYRKQQFEPLYFNNQIITTFSLYNWQPQKSNALSSLMRACKYEENPLVWDFYACQFLTSYLSSHKIKHDTVLIPSPSKNLTPDHAFNFAFALSQRTGLPLLNALRRNNGPSFKDLKKSARLNHIQNRLAWNEKFTKEILHHKNVIFVDDVITTGATTISAFNLIDMPKSFEAWSLSKRTF